MIHIHYNDLNEIYNFDTCSLGYHYYILRLSDQLSDQDFLKK